MDDDNDDEDENDDENRYNDDDVSKMHLVVDKMHLHWIGLAANLQWKKIRKSKSQDYVCWYLPTSCAQ